MGRVLRWALQIAGFACALGILGGYLGALHPIGDSLAVFRLWFALVLAVIAVGLVLLGAWRFGVLRLPWRLWALHQLRWLVSCRRD